MAVTLLKRWLSWPNRPISFPLAVWSLISLFLSCTVTCSLTRTHSHTTKKLCLTNQKWNSNQFNTGQIAQKACVCMCALCARGQGVCLCEVRTNRYASLHRVEKANGYLLGANEKDRGYVSVRSVIFQAVSNIWLWHLLFSFFLLPYQTGISLQCERAGPLWRLSQAWARSIPLTSHATQTHKHSSINTRTFTHKCTHYCPASKGCCVHCEGGGIRGPALVSVYFSDRSRMEVLRRPLITALWQSLISSCQKGNKEEEEERALNKF